MQITRVDIQNFLTIGEASLRLDERGLVLISGENRDDSSCESNGAGKSSLADAIFWCLFNETARGITGDAVVNRRAGKNAQVAISFTVDNVVHTVVRNRKHDSGRNQLFVFRETANISKHSDAETQKLVEQLLGCSKDVFQAAVYSGQEAMPNLPQMTDKYLKLLVEQAAGTEILQRCQAIANDRLHQAGRLHEQAEAALMVERLALEQLEKQLATLTFTRSSWEEERNQEVERLQEEQRVAYEGALEIRAQLADWDGAVISAELKEIDRELNSYKTKLEEKAPLEKAVTDATAEWTTALAYYTQQGERVTDAERALATVSNRVGTNCGECGRKYTAKDIAPARELAEQTLTQARESLARINTQCEACEGKIELATANNEGFKLPDVSTLNARSQELNEQQRNLLRAEASIAAAEDHYKNAASKVEVWLNGENPYDRLITNNQTEQEEARKRIMAAEELLAQTAANLQRHENALELYGPAGVRAHILDTVTPYLNERTAHYLGTLSDGNITATWNTISKTSKGELREKFAITVTNSQGGGSFGSQSGGERRKIRLACALALQDLVSARATRPLRLWIGDEIDDALDPAGLERLMAILEEKARERGTVLVISHNDISDWIREQVMVTKHHGLATVEGSICDDKQKGSEIESAGMVA